MVINIKCKFDEHTDKFDTIHKIYKQLEGLANTRQDNPLYALCYDEFSDLIRINSLQHMINNNNDEDNYITFYLNNNTLSKGFQNTNTIEDDGIIITSFYPNTHGFSTKAYESVAQKFNKVYDSRVSSFYSKIDDVVTTLKELGFKDVYVQKYNEKDLSFLSNKDTNKVQLLNNIMYKIHSPIFDFNYTFNVSVEPISSNNIEVNTENFQYFILAYTDFYNKIMHLFKKFNFDTKTINTIESSINMKYKDLYDIFYNTKHIANSFKVKIHNDFKPRIDIYHYNNVQNEDGSNNEYGVKIKQINIEHANTDSLKNMLEFYNAFNTTMAQIKEKHGNTFNTINATLTLCVNNDNFILSDSIQTNIEKVVQKINEITLESLVELDNYK